MLDQSFSARNFEIIYGIESRKGTIDLESMPPYYQDAVKSIKEARRSECELRARMKSASSCPEEKERTRLELAEIKESLSELKRTKSRLLQKYLEELSQEVNARDFRFQLKCLLDPKAAKAVFTLGAKSHAAFFAMKQLQYNLRNTFKVCPANRRHILVNVKIFLNSKIPVYIIRTDIDSFFESIPQNKLKDLVLQESLLSPKSRSFVKGILNEYEQIKSKDASLASLPKGCGVPRGVGISSYLSEIYLRGLDRELSNRREVLYYARYVDDIFIILSGLDSHKTLEDYYKKITELCDREFGLKLKQPDASDKCQLEDFYSKDRVNCYFNYLGYRLRLSKEGKKGLECNFFMKKEKLTRIKDKINKAISHFNSLSKYDVKQAYKDLVDSLKYLTGNISLNRGKSGVKVGLYYSNDLLSEDGVNSLAGLTKFLHSRKVTPYNRLVGGWILKARIERMFRQIDFVKCWEEKRFNNLSSKRIRQIESWL
ncbi:MAG: RNA-directed DNA polymerase [Porphyromonadaceae bacterium]|jgi:hypothetical protein|nr:RNA-directed DNA polymerase [Porphyromonadaceae bacterium]